MALPNLLSLNFLVPFVAGKIDFSRAIRGLRGMPRRLLLIGHKLTTGTQLVNTITPISNEAEAIERLGEGSMLLAMWRAAKANADLGLPIDIIAIAEGGSAVKATSTVTIGTVPTTAGEVALYIGGERIAIGATPTDTVTQIATRLAAAVNANARLPVTAASALGVVTLTARHGGPIGNEIDVRTLYFADDRLPAGLVATIVPMVGGAVSPDVSPVIAAMNMYRATEIVMPFTDSANMAILETELATRWLANNMQDGMAVTALRGTEATLTTWLSTRNSPHVHTITVTKDTTTPYETAAMAGAAIERNAAIDPAVGPTARLLGYKGPSTGNHFTIEAINNLLNAGGSSLNIAQDASGSLLRMVTNYTLSPGGAPDRSMAEMCWLKTMSYYRWFIVTEFVNKYNNAGYKLAQYIKQPIPGQKIMTPDLGQEVMIGIYKLFQDAGLTQNLPYYISTLVVEIDAPNGKLKIKDEPVILTQHYQTEVTSYAIAGQV